MTSAAMSSSGSTRPLEPEGGDGILPFLESNPGHQGGHALRRFPILPVSKLGVSGDARTLRAPRQMRRRHRWTMPGASEALGKKGETGYLLIMDDI